MIKNIGNYVIGLDIGIGSVGWAVVTMGENARIERFGVEIFDSGEKNDGKDRKSQERRLSRSTRRLLRRRSHRKSRLKYLLKEIGFTTEEKMRAYFESGETDAMSLRVKALDEKVSPEQLAACLINICNLRGYAEFYEKSDDDTEDEAENMQGVQNVREKMSAGGYRTVAEMFVKDAYFSCDQGKHRRYRNREGYAEKFYAPRDMVQKEAESILEKQGEYYPVLKDKKQQIIDIIFSQRAFEDGPGNVNDPHRKYRGFGADNVGKCRFYPEENRGLRFTYLSDMFTLINAVSQCRFVDEDGVVCFPREMAEEILEVAAREATFGKKMLKEIATRHGIKDVIMPQSEKESQLTNSVKYLKQVKNILIKYGYSWESLIKEDVADIKGCFLNELGVTLSSYITPRLRKRWLKEIERIAENPAADALINELCRVKCSGTSAVSYRYMSGAVEAFKSGDIVGVYQDKINKEQEDADGGKRYAKLPPFDKACDFYDNPVVIRSLNETRKIINRIIENYGAPYQINVEVGKDVNVSADNRKKAEKEQKDNEKARAEAKTTIAELLRTEEGNVTENQITRYILGEVQGWKCMYSGEDIEKRAAISGDSHYCEIDHIVPFSKILDDTLNNKVLVLGSENQFKGQRVPLEFITDKAKRESFLSRINDLYKNKKISKKKYEYLRAERLTSELVEGWKSRNLNDTRYIAKFLVGYLDKTLVFADRIKGAGRQPRVYAVKGSITSMLRRTWLNADTWGITDKKTLKEFTYLDHAADAIVIANCIPAYVEIASSYKRLGQILRANQGKPNDEYKQVINAAATSISRYYNMEYQDVYNRLNTRGRVPSLIKNVAEEVDVRLTDVDSYNRFMKMKAEKNGETFEELPPEKVEEIFREKVGRFYCDDAEFANSVKMPFTVLKANRKASGTVTDSNPIRIINIDGKDVKLRHKAVMELKESDFKKIATTDEDLRSSLIAASAGVKDKITFGQIYKNKIDGNEIFVTEKGKKVRRVTLIDDVKRIITVNNNEKSQEKTENAKPNYSYYTDASYYCVEVYKDKDGNIKTFGIAFSDIVKKKGKLWLKENFVYPEGYDKHVMYLFYGDYLRVYNNKGKLKFEGYYKGVKNINRSNYYYFKNNSVPQDDSIFSITKKDIVRKFEIDILGEVKGEVKCGAPLSLIKAGE